MVQEWLIPIAFSSMVAFFMNSPFVRRQAERLVRRLANEAGDEREDAEETGAEGRDGDETRAGGEGGAGRVADGEGSGEDAADDGDGVPARFPDRAMIRAAYPLLYGREVSEAELEAGLAFLAERRASVRKADETEAADGESASAVGDSEDESAAVDGRGASPEGGPDDLAERRASMQAWIQYARALFSAAEFRFVE